jgi:hypothetical protein
LYICYGKQWSLIKKLKIELLCDPEIPLLVIDPKEYKSGYKKATANPCLL